MLGRGGSGEGPRRQRRDLVEGGVVHIAGAGAEVGGVEQGRAVGVAGDDRRRAGRDGQALVDGSRLLVGVGVREVVPRVVHGDDAVGARLCRVEALGVDGGVPADEGAVLGGEQEDRRGGYRVPILVHAAYLEPSQLAAVGGEYGSRGGAAPA